MGARPRLTETAKEISKYIADAGPRMREVGPRLIDRIDNERRNRRAMGIDPERQSARQSMQTSLMGTTHIRSRVDMNKDHGVSGLEGCDAHA